MGKKIKGTKAGTIVDIYGQYISGFALYGQ
jgi:hypothetical protein